MHAEDLNDSMPGLPPVQRTRSAYAGMIPEDAFEVPGDSAIDALVLNSVDHAVFENLTAHEATVGPIPDNVTLPKHYARFKIEPIRFVAENGLDFFRANIIKYIMRHDAKNGMEDLKKAQRYLEMFIKFKQDDPDWWKAPS